MARQQESRNPQRSSADPKAEAVPEVAAGIPREIWVMVAAAFIIALGYGLIAPLLPQFVVSFDVSLVAAGAVVSVFSATRLIFAPVSGNLVDRLGSRRTYLTGLLVVAVTTGLVSVAGQYWHILLLRGLSGVGSTMFTVSAMGMIVKLSPPLIRGKCSALYGTAFLLGNVVGPLLGAGLSFLGFRWPFLIYGILVGLAAAVVWWLMPKIDSQMASGGTVVRMKLSQAWENNAYRAALTSNFAHGWINMGVRVSVLPLFAAAVFAHGAAVAGVALASFAAGTAVVLQFSGKLADYVGRKPPLIAGLVGSAVFVGILGFADNALALVAVSVLAGAASGLINPAQQAALADVVGNGRSGGQVMSVYQMAGDCGQILGPVIIGLLADHWGFRTAFGACSLVAVLGCAAWLCAKEPLQQAHPLRLHRIRTRH